MQDVHWLPPILLGALVGWIGRSMAAGDTLPIGSVLTATATVLVGWLIQRAIRRQGELDKIPIENISRVCKRIEDLIFECLDRPQPILATDATLLTKLMLLSNEVDWLGSVAKAVDVDDREHAALVAQLFAFKVEMTNGRHAKIPSATAIARNIRTQCLTLHWQICRRIVDQPADLESLLKSKPGLRH